MPPAKEIIPGMGLLVHCGGIANHAKQNMVKREESINIRVVALESLMRSTKYPHYLLSFSRVRKLLLIKLTIGYKIILPARTYDASVLASASLRLYRFSSMFLTEE